MNNYYKILSSKVISGNIVPHNHAILMFGSDTEEEYWNVFLDGRFQKFSKSEVTAL